MKPSSRWIGRVAIAAAVVGMFAAPAEALTPRQTITTWSTNLVSIARKPPTAIQETTLCQGHEGTVARATVRLLGGNATAPDVVSLNVIVRWCYAPAEHEIYNRPSYGTTGTGRFGWAYGGITGRTLSHGTAPGINEVYSKAVNVEWTLEGSTQDAHLNISVFDSGGISYQGGPGPFS